ncbi:hypothetical protein [Deinococcus multiflagellatus]|uniref:Uncharacterized protein n=1 Tax=Deinococcus multiflagellatus TaxID=1656887 RepID=A0ABW1ZPP2_9DEIO|nr:hypothetical protein [Deinococcus multiflagellatus]MBZ9715362.1 hypothetical protein [Deinococcus multiflagellatus]
MQLNELRLILALRDEPSSVQGVCARMARTGPALEWHAADEALDRLAAGGLARRVGARYALTINRAVEQAIAQFREACAEAGLHELFLGDSQ